ncbi:MAG TPA: metallophosphoesterase [Tepidisphaeraceae bacterium]
MNWVIGDIHGMHRPLSALLTAVSGADSEAQFIFVGDYVNRGPDSRRVIDLLLTLPRATFLRGNHDDIFDLLVNGDCYICHPTAPNRITAFTWFIQHGLAETLMSYGVDGGELDAALQKPSDAVLDQMLKVVPPEHRRFFRGLEAVYESSDFFVAHGYWDPDEPDSSPSLANRLGDDAQLRYQLLWGRFSESQLTRKKKWTRTGYFGHTPISSYRTSGGDLVPIRGNNIVLLDTASALSTVGMLSAVCTKDGAIIQADRAGEIFKSSGD